ncbi:MULTISPECIES: hypothetical protein [unclassified Streptomyces]|uniref:hypothetical protein n=1 Tax=unclassified Streptomyces TaxID=2593676 RepID=UPI00093A5025|nr:hypothetical protein [Streptomyces sp. CB01580]OKJ42283.1 hypothetical protein AMK22_05055 [Streptomyces sp. CB01580]
MAILHTPVEGFTGPGPGGTAFVNGRAETDDPAVIAYARRHGYEVEETKPRRKTTETPKE